MTLSPEGRGPAYPSPLRGEGRVRGWTVRGCRVRGWKVRGWKVRGG